MKKTLLVTLFVVICGGIMTSCALIQPDMDPNNVARSAQYENGKFHNTKRFESFSWSKLPGFIWRQISEERVDVEPTKPIEVQSITQAVLASLPDDRVSLFRLGHSSFLFKADGNFWLIDPVFSERASPFSFMGSQTLPRDAHQH